MQGRRNSKISGEAAIENTTIFALFPQKLVSQPLKSGEAAASPVPPLLEIFVTFMNNFMCLFRKSALVNDFPQDFTQNIELKGHITAVH